MRRRANRLVLAQYLSSSATSYEAAQVMLSSLTPAAEKEST